MSHNRAVGSAAQTGSIPAAAFARLLRRLPEHLPVSDAYEAEHLPGKRWWSSQREHMVGWFSELAGPGAFNRKSRGLDAKHGYNHLQCAPGLLWIAEALGEDPAKLTTAAAAAAPCRSVASQCAAIRNVIPWASVEAMARNRMKPRRRFASWRDWMTRSR